MNIDTTTCTSDADRVLYKLIRHTAASARAGKDTYIAQVLIKETYGLMDIAKRMENEGCLLKANTVALVLHEFAELVTKLVAEGRAVNIKGLMRLAPSIRGTFTDDAVWNPEKNTLVVNASIRCLKNYETPRRWDIAHEDEDIE